MAEVDVPSWLKSLALAPEYHPTEAEFLDPIDYIFKIEQEASQYGICKIVPPHSKAPKRVVFNNLNLSLANSQDATATGEILTVGRNMCPARSMSGGNVPASAVGLEVEAGGKAKFTTRRQQLGWNARKVRGGAPQSVVHKLVWQSGETYTLDQFEAKAKIFARNRLGTSQEVAPLAVEALFWKAAFEKAISIEYANDIPGSAFAEPREATVPSRLRGVLDEVTTTAEVLGENELGPGKEEKAGFNKDMGISDDEAEASKGAGIDADNARSIDCKLSNSAWNMRKVARSPGSLLRFIPDEVPGVTSPMVYIGMLFSWFAWHVEDHELHSLNYLHTGAPKTWYAVPGDAAPALEEVVRVHGYGGQLNTQGCNMGCPEQKKIFSSYLKLQRDAFARLGEKTTVMSPEVLVAAGVPCCRLVQNAGEYVVTFPRAYHLGFSHGFNCGEAANFATPGWLEVAREASVRRAAMNYLPMLSHQQLLYMLAMSLISRSIFDIASEKRSSRLKEKKRVGEEVVKSMFVNDVIQQNDFIGKLLDIGVASCLLVKDSKIYASHAVTSMAEWNDPHEACRLGKKNQDEITSIIGASGIPASENPVDVRVLPSSALVSVAAQVSSVEHKENREPRASNNIDCNIEKDQVCEDNLVTSALPRDLSTMPCAACGILCYTGMAIVRPSQSAAASFRRLRSHASGPGSRRSKDVPNPPSGVLPGKADKKSADFHMLPNEVQPLLELEGTTPDVFTDAVYEDQTEELEVWTPDLQECPTTHKDSSNDASAHIERNNNAEDVKASFCVENVGLTLNNIAGDAIEVDKQNHDIESGLRSAVSVDIIAQNSNAEGTKCSLKLIELKADGEGPLSSLQLLAATYDDSDIEEYDLVEHGDEGNVVSCPLLSSTNHITDLSGLNSENLVLRPASSNLASSSPNCEMNLNSLTSKNLRPNSEPSGINISPPDSQALTLQGTTSCVDELSEKHWKSSTELESCKQSWIAREDSRRTMTESFYYQSNSKSDHDEAVARDGAKRKSASSFVECVTCSLPHDSFFDSFEDVALKNVDDRTMRLENSSEKTHIHNSCDETSRSCRTDAPAINLEAIETVGVSCTPTLKVDMQLADGSSVTTDSPIKVVEVLDNSGSPSVAYANHKSNGNITGELHGVLPALQTESSAPNQLQILKGAARPRVLCLEHAVVAQKRLESIGGGTAIIICNFSFLKVERHAKAIAGEVGVQHQWRAVPFQKAGDEDYKVIAAAVEAEQYVPGDSDWIDQLGLSVYGQNSSLSMDVEITNGNPSSEEIEELGSRAWRKGRKEKKSSVIRQWCGKGWRVDQLHPLLGGCRNVTGLVDNTSAAANLCTSNVVYNLIENGRLRKVMRPARSAEYATDGRAPKGELYTKKPINKRKILLEMSEDEIDEQRSEVVPSRLGGSDNGICAQTTLRSSIRDDFWREVPIASTDSFLLPLQLSDAAAEKGHDFFSFSPQLSPSKDMYLAASLANSSANNVTAHSGGSQSCAVVGGFLQRGAKLQALQKLCRQLSTSEAISVPCTPLTTPSRYASWMNSKSNFHKRISTAKLVNRLKRKPTADDVSLDVKKQKFVEVIERKNEFPPSRGESSSGHCDNGECVSRKSLTSEIDIISIRGDELTEDLSGSRDVPGECSGGLRPDISSNHYEITAVEGESKLKENEESREEQHDNDLQAVQDCNSRLLGNSTKLSPNKSISQEYLRCRVEHLPQELNHCSPDKSFLSQTRNIDDPTSVSTSIYCTEFSPLGTDEQNIRQDLVEPSIEESPILVPRRVRGKRTKSRNWKSFIHMTLGSDLSLEEKFVFPRGGDEGHTSDNGSSDPVGLNSKLSSERCGSRIQEDPDFFPHFNCLTSSTATVRRLRIWNSGMNSEWEDGKCKGNEGEAEGSAYHPSVQQDTKITKKRKNGNQKSSATKRCEADLEGEFQCDIEGCIMAFDSVRDLELHKKNRCTWKGCGKHFHMHKYLLQHRRVHLDDRPLKCPWKGCTQAFKWAWARTEHIRVHTGERPYKCLVSGCGQTFRFVSDFSRHKRNTGHRPT